MLTNLPSEVIVHNIVPFLDTSSYSNLRSTCSSLKQILEVRGLEKLLPHQISHYYHLLDTLKKYHIAMDISLMGTGKTYVACCIALYYRYPLLVICPKSVINVWEKVTEEFGIKAEIWTYAKLRGKNPYLASSTTTTKLFRDKVEKGLFLIFDECHALKNKSTQSTCALALAKAIKREKNPTLFISASPIDKPQQCLQYMKLMGIMTKDRLARNDIHEGYIREGMQEIFDFCKFTKKEEDEIEEKLRNKKAKNQALKEMFLEYLKPKFLFAMPPPKMKAKIDIRNEFYSIKQAANTQLLTSGLNTVNMSLKLMSERSHIQGEALQSLHMFMKGVNKIETAKMEIVKRIIPLKLEENKNNKVIVCVSFLDSINSLNLAFARYRPLILVGATTLPQRKERVNAFQNDPNRRLLICNIQIASLGISLDDTNGNSPRFMYIIPNYRVIDMYQAALRIYRTNTQSKATIIYLYNSNERETHIANILRKKAKVINEIVSSDFCDAIINPDKIRSYKKD